MFLSHICRQFFDLRKIALHFAPAMPHCVVWAPVERTLERSHTMFQVHHKQLLLYDSRRIVEGEEVGERIAVVFRLLEPNRITISRHDILHPA